MNSDYQSEYLPPHFWYHGMNKIKAGKGYRDGRPVGPLSGPCPECDGTIISVKMNTSAKGFETTNEKVCDKCGLVIPGAFQVLEPKNDNYKSKPFDTHEQWVKQMKPSDKSNDDVAWDAELYEHINGVRMNTSDDVGYGGPRLEYNNRFDHNKRVAKAIWRLNKTPQSMKISSSDRNIHKYHELADDYIHMLQLNKVVAADIHWYIDHNKMYMGRYKVEDIVYHLCLVYGHDYLLEHNEYNQNLYDLLCSRV